MKKKRAPKADKGKSARRAVNIKVNVVSKNPRRKKRQVTKRAPVRRVAKRRATKRAPARRVAKRTTSKRKVSRFVICARTRGGKHFYETAAGKFIADRKQARLFPSQTAASKEAHRMLSKMPATVKALSVERA